MDDLFDLEELGPIGLAILLLVLIIIVCVLIFSDPKPEPSETPVDITVESWAPDPNSKTIPK